MECHGDPAQILRPCFPCNFCNQQYFYSQASLCEHEMNDHGYVRPATVTTARIAPTLRDNGRTEEKYEDWYSVADTGVAEPYWAQWTKENEGCLREYVLNIRTSRSFQFEDAGLSLLDFVPDYSASNFPKSLFTKLNGDTSHLNAEPDTSENGVRMEGGVCPDVSVESEEWNTDTSANFEDSRSEFTGNSDVEFVGMEVDSENANVTYYDTPVNEGHLLVDLMDGGSEQIGFQGENPTSECFADEMRSGERMIHFENEIPLGSGSAQDQAPLSFATEEQIPDVEEYVCEEIPEEALTSHDQLQINGDRVDSVSNRGSEIVPSIGVASLVSFEETSSPVRVSADNVPNSDGSESADELEQHSGNEIVETVTQAESAASVSSGSSRSGRQSSEKTEILTEVDFSSHGKCPSRQQKSKTFRDDVSSTSSQVSRCSSRVSAKSKSPTSSRVLRRKSTRLDKIGRTRSQTLSLSPNKSKRR